VDDVLGRLAAVLLDVRDPDTGRGVVRSVADPRRWGRDPAIGGPQGGDLYVDLEPGFAPSAALRGKTVESVVPRGEHLQDPRRPEMLASFAIAGPGISAGAGLGVIRQIDVAPTLAALLGISPPAQSVGGVLCGALARLGGAPGVESAPSDFPRCASPAVFESPPSP
jgi:hypothetical protein